ncbi:MAG: hypothetical protein IK093_12130 [Ruminiclostridium sp.]|nr:hypothetical protein [Ruminiclostridium sp.]
MKTKSNKIILIAALLAAIVCGAVRYFQIISLTDFETGFFLRGSELGGAPEFILLGVCSVLLILLAFVGKKHGDPAYFVSSAGMGDNATRWLGASEALGGLMIGYGFLNETAVFDKVVVILIALVFLASGAVLLGRIKPPKFTGHIKLLAALLLFFRAATLFNADLLIRNHAEKLIVLFAYVLFSAFSASNARFYARIETKNTRVAEISLALLTFLFSATHVISDLLAMAFGGAGAAAFVSIDMQTAAAAIISGMFLCVIFFTEKKKDIIPVAE